MEMVFITAVGTTDVIIPYLSTNGNVISHNLLKQLILANFCLSCNFIAIDPKIKVSNDF